MLRKFVYTSICFILSFCLQMSLVKSGLASETNEYILPADDWYGRFEEVFGNISSIEQAVPTNLLPLSTIYSPDFICETEEYTFQVSEMWTDGNVVYANIELVVMDFGIIRPYEWSLASSRYYTEIDKYSMPVYFFLAQTSVNGEPFHTASDWGISNNNQRMNRIQFVSLPLESSVTSIEVLFEVFVAKYDTEYVGSDRYVFSLTCPVP